MESHSDAERSSGEEEAMAEAALLLSSCDPEKVTGRITYSGELLAEFGREMRALDGSPFLG